MTVLCRTGLQACCGVGVSLDGAGLFCVGPQQISASLPPGLNCRLTSAPSTCPLPFLQPSFDPGVESTPFMTWGDIEGTPLRIEAEDLPPGPLMGACQKA